MEDWRERASRRRQWPALEDLRRRLEDSEVVAAGLLLGSFAAGRADDLSDVDVLVLTANGEFPALWRRRHDLHGRDVLLCWDDIRDDLAGLGGHKWLTADLVLVECLLAEPRSGVRLAEPHAVVTGDARILQRVTRRPPVSRDEMSEEGLHPVEVAYDRLKTAIRDAQGR